MASPTRRAFSNRWMKCWLAPTREKLILWGWGGKHRAPGMCYGLVLEDSGKSFGLYQQWLHLVLIECTCPFVDACSPSPASTAALDTSSVPSSATGCV